MSQEGRDEEDGAASDVRREPEPGLPPPPAPAAAPLGWHVISGEDLLGMLRRVSHGEDPDMVYMEEYANATIDKGETDVSST